MCCSLTTTMSEFTSLPNHAGSLLCQHCSSIDLDQLFPLQSDLETVGPVWGGQSTAQTLPVKGCRLCDFFVECMKIPAQPYSIVYRSNDDNATVVPWFTTASWDTQKVPCLMFANTEIVPGSMELTESGIIILDRNYPGALDYWRRRRPYMRPSDINRQLSSADWGMIRAWIANCYKHPAETCGDPAPPLDLELRVIDIQTRRIVTLEQTQTYVALSYVWGSGHVGTPPEPTPGTALPVNLPKVVEDAITATRSIGIRHLWIDRYCISQTDTQHRRRQIMAMGRIYTAAHLTIIAAAGDDAEYGLPGVSTTPRRPLPSVELGKHHLVCCSYPSISARASKWNSWGWTYQEGMLSRRRLIFCDSQVYMQCRTGHCAESLILDGASVSKDGDRWGAFRRGHLFTDFARQAISEGRSWLTDRIHEYLSRDLTYDNDRLNAFQGILGTFAEKRPGFIHLLGIPLHVEKTYHGEVADPDVLGLRGGHPATSLDVLLCGLSWHFNEAMERRTALPSWTWAGWKCRARSGSSDNLYLTASRWSHSHFSSSFDFHIEHDISIGIQFKSGLVWKWLPWLTTAHDVSDCAGCFLWCFEDKDKTPRRYGEVIAATDAFGR
ncbi:heterokaryon incompatibility protein-domain-containing protein [Coniochaeta sp. 2T2.1]|nr:heterokaryon incompatibility protein-domain-containing protein [Coniochaeta sp. 2T2.1]